MTENEMNKFAALVAEKVLDVIETKQKEWDIEFQADMQNYVSDSTAILTKVDVNEKNLLKIKELKIELAKALEDENYNKAIIIDAEIKKLNNRLK